VSEEMMVFGAKERQALNRECFEAAGSNADSASNFQDRRRSRTPILGRASTLAIEGEEKSKRKFGGHLPQMVDLLGRHRPIKGRNFIGLSEVRL
jgi:hypothetical protein